MPKYSYLFKDSPNNKQYLFVSNLGSGRFNQVQLVKNTSTGNLLVRKVAKDQPFGPRPPQSPANEVQIIHRLQSFPPSPSPTPPNLAHLLTSHDLPIPSPQTSPPSGTKYARISYWTLYNGGTITQLLTPRIRRPHDVPAVYPIPYAVIARFIWQTCEALQHLYRGSPDEMIFHGDLHGGNIFIHWGEGLENESEALPDFYIGDFGNSKSVSTSGSNSDPRSNIPWPWDVSCTGLLKCLRGLIKAARLGVQPDGAAARDAEIERVQKTMHLLNLEEQKRDTDLAPGLLKGWADVALFSVSDSAATVVSLVDSTKGSSSSYDTRVGRWNGMSRPPDLSEVICRAKKLERVFTSPGDLDERGTEVYRGFCRRGRQAARELVGREPYVFELEMGARALGSWWRVGSSGRFLPMDIPSPWYVARLLEEENGENGGGGSSMYRCCIVGDETGYIGSGTRGS